MIRKSILLLLVPGIAAAAPKKNGWAVEGAPYRVALRADSPPDMPEAGWQIRLPDFGAGRPDMRDVVLLGPDGAEIALDPVWRGQGRALLLLAESVPGEGAFLYFGGQTSRRMKSWSAKRSLLLETRRLPEGANITTFAGWQDAWRKSSVIDGAAFVPMVFHGDNPFGESSRFMSRYSGWVKTGAGGAMRFYTLSDDVSYVTINGSAVLKWQKNQPPPLDPRKVPLASFRMPKEFASVEYCHAVVDLPAAMVLGWEKDGKLGNVPPEAWVHPGSVKSGVFESADGAPVPSGELEAGSYIGYGGEWYVMLRGSITPPGEGWRVEWLWPDGRIDTGTEIRRLWMSLDPARVIVRLRNGARVIEGRRTLMIPRNLDAASVNRDKQLVPFLELLDRVDPANTGEADAKAAFILAKDFLPPVVAAQWAEAWLKTAKPQGPVWVSAMKTAIRQTARKDPKAALERLLSLPAEARAALGREADLLELDLRVFDLKDPMVAGLAARLEKSGDKTLARMAAIRLGDYHLLNGRIEEATRCFTTAAAGDKEDERKAPVIDRSHSLAIEDLVNDGHPDEALAKLDAWERLRPMARIDGDQLYWRARVLFLCGEFARALQDLETSLRIRPGSPEEIDVRFWQGRALFELGRKDEARAIWNQLIKDYPKHERADAAKSWTGKS